MERYLYIWITSFEKNDIKVGCTIMYNVLGE